MGRPLLHAESARPSFARPALLAFALAAVIYGFGASQRVLWNSDEHRYVEVAREMGEAGWLVPRLNGELYVHKPPGYFWAVLALERISGLEIHRAATAVSALAAAGSVAAVLATGAHLVGLPLGVAAAVVFATSANPLALSTRATLDGLLALFVTLSFFFAVRREFGPVPGASRRDLVASAIFAGLGVLVKGPVALAIPAVTLAVYQLCAHGLSGLRPRVAVVWLLLALLPGALWLALALPVAGADYARALVIGHGVGHPLGWVNKQEPPWFYAEVLPQGLLPWAVFLPLAIWRAGRRRFLHSRAHLFVAAWSLAPLVLLTLFPAKRSVYLLPVYPGFALLLAAAILHSLEAARLDPLLRFGCRAHASACVLLGALLAAAGILTLLPGDGFLAGIHPKWPLLEALIGTAFGVGAVLAGVGLLVLGGLALSATSPAMATRRVLAASLLAGISLVWLAHPIESAAKSEVPFLEEASTRIGAAPIAWYGKRDFSASWFLGRDRVAFLRTPADLDRFLERTWGRVFLIAERPKLERLGQPEDARVVLEMPRALAPNLVLLRVDRGQRAAGDHPQA